MHSYCDEVCVNILIMMAILPLQSLLCNTMKNSAYLHTFLA